MSMWIFCESGLNALSRPVTRSSKRAPIVQHHVAAVHREIGLVGAVHAQHAEELRIGGRIGAEPHQRAGAGKAGHAHEAASAPSQASRPGVDHAAAGVDHRPLRLLQQRHRAARSAPDRARSAGGSCGAARSAAARRARGRSGCPSAGRSPPARAGRCARHRTPHAPRGRGRRTALHQVVVLGRRAGDAGGVGLLEGVVADQMRRHLARSGRPPGCCPSARRPGR